MFVSAHTEHGPFEMEPFSPGAFLSRKGAGEAEAVVVVVVRRVVVVPVRRRAVGRIVVPATTAFHPVRTRGRTFSRGPII